MNQSADRRMIAKPLAAMGWGQAFEDRSAFGVAEIAVTNAAKHSALKRLMARCKARPLKAATWIVGTVGEIRSRGTR